MSVSASNSSDHQAENCSTAAGLQRGQFGIFGPSFILQFWDFCIYLIENSFCTLAIFNKHIFCRQKRKTFKTNITLEWNLIRIAMQHYDAMALFNALPSDWVHLSCNQRKTDLFTPVNPLPTSQPPHPSMYRITTASTRGHPSHRTPPFVLVFRSLLPIFGGGGGIKTLSPQKQDPLSMSDLNLHPPPAPPLGVLLVEMRGCPTTFGIGRGSGGGSMQIVVESMRGRVTPTGDAEIYGGTTTIMFSLLVFVFCFDVAFTGLHWKTQSQSRTWVLIDICSVFA